MRTRFVGELARLESDELLTTGEAAKLLGVSRQHVVDLANRGDLPVVMVGSHRRVRRRDLSKQTVRAKSVNRDQLRSLWLGYAVAGQIVADPVFVIETARDTLRLQTRKQNQWDREWVKLLDGPVEQVLEALTADTIRSRELRQNSPFTGALSQDERQRVLDQFRSTHAGDAP